MMPKAITPPETTKQVATVLQSAPVFVKSQIAKMQDTTQITMQTVKTANETVRTRRGFMNPRFGLANGGSGGVSITLKGLARFGRENGGFVSEQPGEA